MAASSNRKTPDVFEGNPPSLRVAMCQVLTEQWAVETNLNRTLAALDEAAAQGAELAITPECLLHGYGDPKTQNYPQRMLEIAERLDGPNVTTLRQKAKVLGMDVIVRFAERGEGDNLHKAAALISADGEIVSVYRKVHCRPFESIRHEGVFVPGNEFSVTELRYDERAFEIGIMICFDREIPESVRCLRSLGAEFIACPLATDTSDMSKYIDFADNEMITRCRAAENEVFIAVVNHAGGEFGGGSFIVGPGGEKLCQMGSEGGVCVLDVPVGAVREKFHNDPLGWMGWGYRRSDVYERYLNE